MKIALVGNPNSGKTTLFNDLTGSNQFVGNWPGVTVEKKSGKLKGQANVEVVDLPGIYSLSPYTLEEEVARKFLMEERPEIILNIVDATNLERNLYLTSQLLELEIPMVIALNMNDVVKKRGDQLNKEALAKALRCPIVEISALKNEGIPELIEKVMAAAKKNKSPKYFVFSDKIETVLAEISKNESSRFNQIKRLERDKLYLEKHPLTDVEENLIDELESAEDEDAEGLITGERYDLIGELLKGNYKRNISTKRTTSDKIDAVVTNRFLALPIFAVVMFLVYFISVTTVGTLATDWANDGLFGDGWYLFGHGRKEYEAAAEDFGEAETIIEGFEAEAAAQGIDAANADSLVANVAFLDENGDVAETVPVDHATYLEATTVAEPDPAEFGTWVPGIPVLVERGLDAINTADWAKALVLEGIIGGVGAVLGFVPQMIVLFLLLAFLEACGYMARIAFILDRIFRKFGLSGKSFIPMLIGTGCSVPGIMASRTIENEKDRRMTILTTSFIPCSAKLPVIALIAGALFNRAWWVAPSAYFVGIAAVLVSGILLKKTAGFAGETAPFVMEMPPYHMPTIVNLLRSMWERVWSFIKKAGTVILLSSIILWFLSVFGFNENGFGMVESINESILARIGNAIAWIFAPLGWGFWQAAVATVTGLIAKENIVGTFGVLFSNIEVADNGWQIWANMQNVFTPLAAYSFLVFNLLCAPCFAAVGAIRREMNNAKWTWFAIAYQTAFAYSIALIIYQFGTLFTGSFSILGVIAAAAALAVILYFLLRKGPKDRGNLALAKAE